MPTYEYRCKACGHQLEIVQAFTDAALTTCPVCAAEELRKVFGSVGIAFKGSGFYKNDSRSTSSSTSAGGSSSSGTNGTATKESSSSTPSSDSTSTAPSTPSPSATPA